MTTATEDAQARGGVGQGYCKYGYYRQPDGWITVSPMAAIDLARYEEEGWTPLRQYGFMEMNTEYAADHPFEALFMFGGAKEMPAAQIIGMAFHLNPPVVPSCGRRLDQNHKHHNRACWVDAQPVSFPQLTDPPKGQPCRFCERPPFPTESAREQHEAVMHKDQRGEIRTGEVLADALVRGLKGTAPQATRKPYACGLCPESFTSPVNLIRHIKKEHGEAKDD